MLHRPLHRQCPVCRPAAAHAQTSQVSRVIHQGQCPGGDRRRALFPRCGSGARGHRHSGLLIRHCPVRPGNAARCRGRAFTDELLSEREQIQKRIGRSRGGTCQGMGSASRFHSPPGHRNAGGLETYHVTAGIGRTEKRATITKAEGDKIAATNLAAAATIMEKTPGAMKLRTLQTIDGLGSGPANTVIMFPMELRETIKDSFSRSQRKTARPPSCDYRTFSFLVHVTHIGRVEKIGPPREALQQRLGLRTEHNVFVR